MIELIVYSFIAMVATASWGKLLFFSIQRDQIFGGWQKVLKRLDEAGNPLNKPLGNCEMCSCFWLALISWLLFFFITDIHLPWYWWVMHYIIYGSIGAMMNLYFLVKLFR